MAEDWLIEKWDWVPRYEFEYQVSNWGRVKSFKRNLPFLMSPAMHRQGYLFIHLSKNGTKKKYYVHRLVADAFLQNPLNLPEVNHKNGIKTNNVIQNLEWASPSRNVLHSFEIGLRKGNYGERNGNSKLSQGEVLRIKDMNGHQSAAAVSRIFNVSDVAILNIWNRKTWKDI